MFCRVLMRMAQMMFSVEKTVGDFNVATHYKKICE